MRGNAALVLPRASRHVVLGNNLHDCSLRSAARRSAGRSLRGPRAPPPTAPSLDARARTQFWKR
eukprot:1641801-Alexandrium_andersonii.AAC.1